MKNLLDLFKKFKSRGQATAVVYRTGVRRFEYSYQEIHDLSLRMAGWLKSQGVGKGDKVILWAPNSPWWVVSFWGAMLRGAVVVPIDFTSQRDRAEKIAQLTDAKIVLQSQYKLDKLTKLSNIRQIEDLEYILPITQPLDEIVELQANDTAELIYTSGTTGDPKGVVLTHKNLVANLMQVSQHISINNKFKFLSLLPLSHMLEQTGGFFTPLLVGGQIVYIRTLKPSAIMEALADEDIYAAIIVPRLLQLLKTGIERKFETKFGNILKPFLAIGARMPFALRKNFFHPIYKKFGNNFNLFVSGGAALDIGVARFWNNLGFKIVEGYGLTECSPVLTANSLEDPVLGTVGKPLPGVQIKIAGGEILAKGDNIFPGYYQNDKATQQVFDNGWFKTGDLGEFDGADNLRIKGRSKDLIVTGAGVNVYPDDVERELLKVNGVKEACVVSLDRGNGEEVHAVLVLEENSGSSIEQVIHAANNNLDSPQQITSFSLWPEVELPKTTTLKIQKFKVKQQVKGINTASTEELSQDRLVNLISKVTQKTTNDIKENSLLVSDLGLTSVARLELINFIEQEYRFDLEDTMINQNTTVGNLRNIILKREQHKVKDHLRMWPNTSWAKFARKITDKVVSGPLFYHYVDLKTSGLENVTNLKTPAIYIANHVSYFDHPAIYFGVPPNIRSRLATASWEEFFFPQKAGLIAKAWKRFCFEYGSLSLNLIPLPQSKGFRKVIAHMGRLVDRNINILIFPEGSRTFNNEMSDFRTGLAIMVNELKIPVVPIRILGIENVFPRGQALPKKGGVTVKFGQPLYFRQESTEEILNTCKEAILNL